MMVHPQPYRGTSLIRNTPPYRGTSLIRNTLSKAYMASQG